MAKTSPGPWHTHNNAASEWEINQRDGTPVCYPTFCAEGDMELMAAAPEMLELLTFFVDMVSAEPVHPMVYKAMKLLERLK